MGDEALVRDPFEYRSTADGRVMISRRGRMVITVAGERANRLIARLQRTTTDTDRQAILARATGNYRRGNEQASNRPNTKA